MCCSLLLLLQQILCCVVIKTHTHTNISLSKRKRDRERERCPPSLISCRQQLTSNLCSRVQDFYLCFFVVLSLSIYELAPIIFLKQLTERATHPTSKDGLLFYSFFCIFFLSLHIDFTTTDFGQSVFFCGGFIAINRQLCVCG